MSANELEARTDGQPINQALQRQQAELEETQLQFRSLFENMLDGYAYCRTHFDQGRLQDFTYLEVNASFERLTGLTGVIGRRVSEVIPGIADANRELFDMYGRVALSGIPEKTEVHIAPLGLWLSIAAYSRDPGHFVALFDNITARKEADATLQKSLAEFRSLAEAMPQIVWITRPDGGNVYFNQQWMDYTGLTLKESVGDGWMTPLHPDDQRRAWDAWQHATRTVSRYSIESRLRRADGVYRWWLVRGVPLQNADGTIRKWFGTCTDIHDLKVAELEIARVNRALKMLSNSNEALTRAKAEPELLNDVCRIAVDVGGYRMAWIGYSQHDAARSVRPMAHAGIEDGYFSEVTVSWNESDPLGRGPAGQAIRSGRAVVRDDLTQDSGFAPWRRFAQQRGYRGNICLPLRDATHTFGVLGLFSADVHHTSADELKLLQELADDLAFGIGNARAQFERARLDTQVREQAALLDIAHEAIMVKDLDGRIVYWNKGAERTYGWSAAEALGRRSDELLDTDLARFQAARTTLLIDDEWQGEEVRRTKDGRSVVVESRWTLVRDDQGRPKSILAINTDVTERKQAGAAIRAAEERTRIALQNANVGIWELDQRAGTLRASEIFESHLGVPSGTFAGTLDALLACIHPLDRDVMRATLADAARSGADFSAEFRVLQADDHVAWLHVKGRVQLDEDGEPVRGVGVSMDVTERHALEEQFHQAQKMEAIGRLAGGVAHDFNNLLTVILGFCEVLLADPEAEGARRADIEEIQKAGSRAAGLTRQLLAFSRKQIIEPTRLDLNLVVADLQAMLGRLIGEDVKTVLRLRPGLAAVRADRGQVEQIVLNLAVNARDAMPKGGTLTIETANVDLDEHHVTYLKVKPGAFVALTVRDTGTGMSAQVQARLFEPFFTTKDVGRGSGLGLATVHGIVTRCGGTVNVDSEVGGGTSFTVYFPRDDTADVAIAAPAPAARRHSGGETVLVVEDADGLRVLVAKLLQRQGYTVLAAASAEEALQLSADNPVIHVVLTDVVMPGTSGPELAMELVRRRPTLRVIYMSGYTEDAIVHHGILDPGITFLHKPFTADTLEGKIRDVLDR